MVTNRREGQRQGLDTNIQLATLTERQHDYLDLAGQGYSDKQIANALKVSINTVKGTLADIRKELGVDRWQIVAWWHTNQGHYDEPKL